MLRVVVTVDEQEELDNHYGECPDWKIDVEAPSPGDFVTVPGSISQCYEETKQKKVFNSREDSTQ